jgi:hypothetical protein
MATQSDTTLAKLTELKHRIEFLRESTNHDILIGAIERELCSIGEFQCTFNQHAADWGYYIRCSIKHSSIYGDSAYCKSKLDALYAALSDLTRN